MLEATARPLVPPLPRAIEALERTVNDVRSASRGSTSAGALMTTLRLADTLNAVAVGMLQRLAPAGDVEQDTGLPIEMALRLESRRARWDARELVTAAEQLAHLPATDAALDDGTISWSQARAILRSIRDLDADSRAVVDHAVESRAPALTNAEPEELIEHVDDVAARLRPDRALRREERAVERSFLGLQPRLGGGGSLYGEADTESFATIAAALDAAAARPVTDEDDGRTRARQQMDALVAICEDSLSGGQGTTRPRPRLIATMDLDGMGLSEAARVLAPVIGRAPRLSPLATEVLACDAEVVPVVFDGARPVAVGDAVTPISAKMRTAVVARDLGCRFPSCSAPASWCDAHHVIPGGPTVESNLVLLCRRCHRRIHRSRWRIRMRHDRTIEFRFRGRTYTSPPRARRPRLE